VSASRSWHSEAPPRFARRGGNLGMRRRHGCCARRGARHLWVYVITGAMWGQSCVSTGSLGPFTIARRRSIGNAMQWNRTRLKAQASNHVHLISKAISEKTEFKITKKRIDMKTKNYLGNPGFLAAFPLLALVLAGASVQSKELPGRGPRHAWSTLYFQPHLQHLATNDWYEPPRSPGWHEEVGN
jgi:hypothetical protein